MLQTVTPAAGQAHPPGARPPVSVAPAAGAAKVLTNEKSLRVPPMYPTSPTQPWGLTYTLSYWAPGELTVMLTLIPWLLRSIVLASWHAEGALSRMHAVKKHTLPDCELSRNRSYRTDVTSMPQAPRPLWCCRPWPPPTGVAATAKLPAQPPAPQNVLTPVCAGEPVGPFHSPSSGGFSSLETIPPWDT